MNRLIWWAMILIGLFVGHKTAAHQILANERAECFSRVLQGQLTDLPQQVPTKVKIFLSATTQGMKPRLIQRLYRELFLKKRNDCACIMTMNVSIKSSHNNFFRPYFMTIHEVWYFPCQTLFVYSCTLIHNALLPCAQSNASPLNGHGACVWNFIQEFVSSSYNCCNA